MKPCTPIYDLTTEDAIVHGRFFYASSLSQPIAFAMVHSFVLNLGLTNQLQSERFTFVRRLMAMWYTRYSQDPIFDPSSFPHVPDAKTEDGLKDLMTIANVLELATVLDRRSYVSSGIHWMELVEMGSSRSMARRLLAIIAQHFVIYVGEQPVAPWVVFQRSLVEFAAAVVVYKEDMSIACKVPGCPPIKVKEKMLALFQSNHPHLLPKLQSLIDSRVEYLSWTGPTISIKRRCNDHNIFRRRKSNTAAMLKNIPLRDFSDFPIYIQTPNGEYNAVTGDRGKGGFSAFGKHRIDLQLNQTWSPSEMLGRLLRARHLRVWTLMWMVRKKQTMPRPRDQEVRSTVDSVER